MKTMPISLTVIIIYYDCFIYNVNIVYFVYNVKSAFLIRLIYLQINSGSFRALFIYCLFSNLLDVVTIYIVITNFKHKEMVYIQDIPLKQYMFSFKIQRNLAIRRKLNVEISIV